MRPSKVIFVGGLQLRGVKMNATVEVNIGKQHRILAAIPFLQRCSRAGSRIGRDLGGHLVTHILDHKRL